jgi:signal transduction histidine kinase
MFPAGEFSLAVHAAVSGMIGLLCTAIWAAAGGGYYWPAWVWLALIIPLSLHFGLREAVRIAPERRAMAIQVVISLVVTGITVAVWALAGFGTFWPIWTILALIVLFVVVLLARLVWRELYGGERERELTERVETLTETRRGALDVQAAELRRIERDLHDGAQARLVALSMQLGRAEEGLADRPEIAALVRQARSEATAANAELRDLARGIAPPVLADRGLAAAVEALGTRAPIPVTVDAQLSRRSAPVVESAAYFVVAESLTNVAKHAPQAAAAVRLRLEGEALEVTVADDGPGGADVTAGSGLDGLRRRVAALDGDFEVSSPAGGGTRIEVRLPCGS